MQEPRKCLIELGLSDKEVTIYLAMISGVEVARDLIKTTGLKRPTVYYLLGCLEKRGLISKTGLEGDKRFSVEPLEKLTVIAEQKTLEIHNLQNKVEDAVRTLSADASASLKKPTVSYYEGVDAVKSTIMTMLYTKSKKIDSIAPLTNFFWEVGFDFVEIFINQRIKRKIITRNLWEDRIEKKFIQKYYDALSEVRILPSVMKGKFQTSVFMYDDKTLYVSSKKNSYCVLITSQEHVDMMRALFEGLWHTSTAH